MSKPRVAVAHYTYPEDIGGVTSWVVPLLEHLVNQPIELAVHLHDFPSASRGERIGSRLDSLGIKVIRVPRQRTLTDDARQTLRFLNQWRPTVFLPQCLPAHFAAASIAGDQGLPWSLTVHSDDPEYWAALDAFSPHQHGGHAVGVSNHLAEKLKAFCGNQPVPAIPYGVTIPMSTASFQQKPFRIIYSGRLHEEQKRIGLVIKTLIRACQKADNIMATVVGDGLLKECRRLVCDAGMDHRIQFTGRLHPDEVKSQLLRHQVLLLMSDFEGLPVALLEGMAAGVVPVARYIPSGIPELIRHRETGLLVSEDPDQAADALMQLSNQSDLWHHCSKQAKSLILSSYEREHTFQAWDHMIENLHARYNAHYPLHFDRSRLKNLPPILHSRYPYTESSLVTIRGKLNTAMAKVKAAIRDNLSSE
jgi:colanic acid/amylovoran biosynthesis glycosyltransferase